MDRLFDMEGPVITFLSRITDFMLINLLFLLCCIPVITIGASITALHYVVMKSVLDQEDSAIIRKFFKAFFQNFKQATAIWLPILIITALVIMDISLLTSNGAHLSGWFMALILVVGVAIFLVAMYAFALMARFENTLRQTVKNAGLMCLRHFPKSIVMMLVYISPVFLIMWQTWGVMAVLLIGFSCTTYINCSMWKDIFDMYT